ncbi:MAG: hypothetical protein QOD77_74 [Thermoplasmata archaeon]|jgi:hypothetical protein|nr:hypothetical protein [Thermoplasmata archaeon]
MAQASTGQYPADLTNQLGSSEQVHFFSWLATKGGCFGLATKRDEYWIALTNQRVLYRAMVRDEANKRTIEREGMVPFSKVSGIEVTNVKADGCAGGKSSALKIGSSGGEVMIPVVNREKGLEVRNAYSRLAHGA